MFRIRILIFKNHLTSLFSFHFTFFRFVSRLFRFRILLFHFDAKQANSSTNPLFLIFDFSCFTSEPKTSRTPRCEGTWNIRKICSLPLSWHAKIKGFFYRIPCFFDIKKGRELLFFCKRCVLGPKDISLNFLIIASLEL